MSDYRGLYIGDAPEGADDAAILALEARLGTSLPEDYRKFLQSCNGAELEYDVLAILANGEEEILSFTLYGVDPSEDWGFNPFELRQLQRQPGFPENGMLPIGRDGGLSLLLLDLRDGRQEVGAMVAGLPGCGQQEDEYVVLSASFNGYLDKLFLSQATIVNHINRFIISPENIVWTLDWLDRASSGWRELYRMHWNARVVEHPI